MDFLTGKAKLDYNTLWGQEGKGGGDHRAPIQAILFYSNFKLFGVNVLPILYFDLTLCVILAAVLIWAAREVRGRTDYADAFLPVVLLNLGHGETFLWAQATVYVRTTFLAGSVLALLLARGTRPGRLSAFLAGMCVVALPLTFGGGVPLGFFLAFWLGYLGYRHWRSPESSARGCPRLPVLRVHHSGCRSRLFRWIQEYEDRPERRARSRVDRPCYRRQGDSQIPGDGPRPGGSASRLASFWWDCSWIPSCQHGVPGKSPLAATPFLRDRAVGLSLYLVACLITSLAAGYARASWGPDFFFAPRYAISSVPTLLGLYFVWETCGAANLKSLGRVVLFSVALSLSMLNWSIGMSYEPRWRPGAATSNATSVPGSRFRKSFHDTAS